MADITIRGLRKSYGSFEVVHAIDLDVRDGEFLVVLGPFGLRQVDASPVDRRTRGDLRR